MEAVFCVNINRWFHYGFLFVLHSLFLLSGFLFSVCCMLSLREDIKTEHCCTSSYFCLCASCSFWVCLKSASLQMSCVSCFTLIVLVPDQCVLLCFSLCQISPGCVSLLFSFPHYSPVHLNPAFSSVVVASHPHSAIDFPSVVLADS